MRSCKFASRSGIIVVEVCCHQPVMCVQLRCRVLASAHLFPPCGLVRFVCSTPLFTQEIDQASGVLMPFYDPDLKILYLGGKGDGNIRYYELADAAPFSYPLSEHRTSVSAKGLAMLPKRACNPLKVTCWVFSRSYWHCCLHRRMMVVIVVMVVLMVIVPPSHHAR